jgi:hypothetical protein
MEGQLRSSGAIESVNGGCREQSLGQRVVGGTPCLSMPLLAPNSSLPSPTPRLACGPFAALLLPLCLPNAHPHTLSHPAKPCNTSTALTNHYSQTSASFKCLARAIGLCRRGGGRLDQGIDSHLESWKFTRVSPSLNSSMSKKVLRR